MESNEIDWSSDSATVIGRARLDLASDGLSEDLWQAPGWETSDNLIRQALAAQLAQQADLPKARDLTQTILELSPGSAGREMAGQALLRPCCPAKLILRERVTWPLLAGLGPSERVQAGQALLNLLSVRLIRGRHER